MIALSSAGPGDFDLWCWLLSKWKSQTEMRTGRVRDVCQVPRREGRHLPVVIRLFSASYHQWFSWHQITVHTASAWQNCSSFLFFGILFLCFRKWMLKNAQFKGLLHFIYGLNSSTELIYIGSSPLRRVSVLRPGSTEMRMCGSQLLLIACVVRAPISRIRYESSGLAFAIAS